MTPIQYTITQYAVRNTHEQPPGLRSRTGTDRQQAASLRRRRRAELRNPWSTATNPRSRPRDGDDRDDYDRDDHDRDDYDRDDDRDGDHDDDDYCDYD